MNRLVDLSIAFLGACAAAYWAARAANRFLTAPPAATRRFCRACRVYHGGSACG